MLDVQATTTPIDSSRQRDISSWQQPDIRTRQARERRVFHRRQAAIRLYFTSDTPVEQIAAHYHLSAQDILSYVALCCMHHEDGTEWGYHALIPDTEVRDHPSQTDETERSSDETRAAFADDILNTDEAPITDEANEATKQDETDGTEDEIETTAKRSAVILPSTPAASDISDTSEQQPEAEEVQEGKNEVLAISGQVQVLATAPEAVAALEPPSLAIVPTAGITLPPSLYVKRRRDDGTRLFYTTQPHRIIVKRSQRAKQLKQQRQKRTLRAASLALLAVLLFTILLPLGAGVAAYSIYTSVRSIALDGVSHLLTVKSILPLSKSDPMAALDTQKLHQAQSQFRLAESDFLQLQQLVSRPDIPSTVDQFSSDYGTKLLMARHLVQVALDVSRMGDELSGVALIGANIIHGSPLASGSSQPLLSVSDVNAIEGSMTHALYYIADIRFHMSQVQLQDVPISTTQKAELVSALTLLPKAQESILQAQGLVSTVAWLLGVGHQRRFLVQTMDRGELRPSGGFTGQYGILQIQDGRMAPFTLRDVALLDYAGNGVELGRPAPPEYRNWMNFGNWGLRDSNLSADYPTTAQMSMQVFQDEGGGPIDGDISFTPTFIGHILDITGPIHVAEYNETITSKNLEERLHYYQQNYSAIALEKQKTNDSSHAVRKAFTSLVGKLLLDRVRHLPTNQLISVIKNAVKDIQSRDLEIYFANPTAESWLVEHGYSGAMNTFQQQDGFMVVQANISISKASEFVHTTEQDNVVLDAQGGATHTLTITLDYQQTGPVYGFDTYADYIRVYVPQSAQFISGDGFDTGQCLAPPASSTGGTPGTSPSSPTGTTPTCCTAGTITTPPPTGGTPGKPSTGKGPSPAPPVNGCAIYKTSFPSTARYCSDGNYDLGNRGLNTPWKIDKLGPPTALTSDLPGRGMFGGLTETPKNCISYITLSWYVPHVVHNTKGQTPYSLLIGKQGGYIPSIAIIVDASAAPIKGAKPYSVTADLIADKAFALPAIR